MASFNSQTKIEMEIDGVEVSIDGLSLKLVKSIEQIMKKSHDLVKKAEKNPIENEEELLKEQEEMGHICIEFLSEILSEEAYHKLVIEKMEDVIYLEDITLFILSEIKKSKEERLLKLFERSEQVYS